MAHSLIAAVGTLMKVQRWNVMPRIEIWTEAENIAYTTHLVYGIGTMMNLSAGDLGHALHRSLLKSINKHVLSDIPVSTRDCIKTLDPSAWHKLIEDAATKSAALFPRVIAADLRPYMTFTGDYHVGGANPAERKALIEELIQFAQYRSALEECTVNAVVYKRAYEDRMASIEGKLVQLKRKAEFDAALKSLDVYTPAIRNLKYLRRWNLLNRSVESSVMGHTFVVALLALVFSRMADHKHQKHIKARQGVDPVFESVLRGLFHDVAETFTGDIITPVKATINAASAKLVERVEVEMQQDFRSKLPAAIDARVNELLLMEELSDTEVYSVSSLVKCCDRLGIVLECLFESSGALTTPEMLPPLRSFVAQLQNAEWTPIREFCTQVSIEFPVLRA